MNSVRVALEALAVRSISLMVNPDEEKVVKSGLGAEVKRYVENQLPSVVEDRGTEQLTMAKNRCWEIGWVVPCVAMVQPCTAHQGW